MEETLPQVRKARLQPIDRAREMAWVENNRSRYAGQWVALDGDRLIAFGNDPLAFKERAKSEGVERPFIIHIKEEPEAYVGAGCNVLSIRLYSSSFLSKQKRHKASDYFTLR